MSQENKNKNFTESQITQKSNECFDFWFKDVGINGHNHGYMSKSCFMFEHVLHGMIKPANGRYMQLGTNFGVSFDILYRQYKERCIGIDLWNPLNHPNIIEVKKEATEKASHFGGSWHSDWSFQKEPPSATLLHSKIIPPVGGDTLFANTMLAYEGLSERLKEEIDGLKVIHTAALPYADDGFYALEDEKDRSMKIRPSKEAKKTFSHPLVRTHPVSKQKGLFINPVYSMCIEGFEKEESDKLLNKLYSHMIQEKYIYRHSWKKNMLVIWDNRAVMHQATGGYDGYDRLLHRITIAGEQPS